MQLHLKPDSQGAHRGRRRKGCGPGSGRGKTACRGGKGQTARSGSSIRPGFEGGQMPLYRKLPRRGFSNFAFRTEYEVVNLSDLEKVAGEEVIDRAVLVKAGIVRDSKKPLKLLARGEVKQAFNLKVDKASASAKAKLEAAGGSLTLSSEEK